MTPDQHSDADSLWISPFYREKLSDIVGHDSPRLDGLERGSCAMGGPADRARRWRRHRRRDREREPGVPAARPALMVEFGITLHVDVALHGPERSLDGEDDADLRADAEHARLEATDLV